MKAKPENANKPSPLSTIVRDGGWMGGVDKPDPKLRSIPLEMTAYHSEEAYQEFVAAMEKTGFWPGDAWYLNHARNRDYTLSKRKNDGVLDFPVLFVSLNLFPSLPTDRKSSSQARIRGPRTECPAIAFRTTKSFSVLIVSRSGRSSRANANPPSPRSTPHTTPSAKQQQTLN
jgi:hypothetical protein